MLLILIIVCWNAKVINEITVRRTFFNFFEGRTGFEIFWDFRDFLGYQGIVRDFFGILRNFWDFYGFFFLKSVRDFKGVIYPSHIKSYLDFSNHDR